MRNRSLAALLAVCLMAATPAALAFNYRFLRNSVLKQLTPADIDIGTRATREALDSGTDGEWTNPATGATGTIRILGDVEIAGQQQCRRTRLDVTARGRSGGGVYTLCRTPSGAWNFHSPPR